MDTNMALRGLRLWQYAVPVSVWAGSGISQDKVTHCMDFFRYSPHMAKKPVEPLWLSSQRNMLTMPQSLVRREPGINITKPICFFAPEEEAVGRSPSGSCRECLRHLESEKTKLKKLPKQTGKDIATEDEARCRAISRWKAIPREIGPVNSALQNDLSEKPNS